MSTGSVSGYGEQFDRVMRGGLPTSSVDRLEQLTRWGGTTSFFSPSSEMVMADVGAVPIGQVVGISVGVIRHGVAWATGADQRARRDGAVGWREDAAAIGSWTTIRRRALERLRLQAATLSADAVVGVRVTRVVEETSETGTQVRFEFVGTAVSLERPFGGAAPVLTLASPPELWALRAAGIEPVGIAGGCSIVQTRPSRGSMDSSAARGKVTASGELTEATQGVYEARRLALKRLADDCAALKPDGLIAIQVEPVTEAHRDPLGPVPAWRTTVHAFATAVRRVRPRQVDPRPLLRVSS